MAQHLEFGKMAEEFIANKYIKNQYTILERNWRFHPLEIDIIAQKEKEIIFVEVKARAVDGWVNPLDAVDYKKKKFLLKAANEYMEQHCIALDFRFDIAIVLKKHDGLAAQIFPDAFEPYEL